ncbi:RDD family protein [Posidoniimonas polymericola]|uniref:RDD family protein n=1 Tax=Posidoniimonas polymericola TaxID=2528002 RepID=A0A5C5YTY2_9BACT|nr:RDD family protein [Posidoniimonas polymericola]TWT78143.1 RDD family protein [Posidoniimonas polymericola]
MPLTASQIDSHVQVVTPENIAFEYRVAGPFGRVMAYLIDTVIFALAILAISIVFGLVFSALDLGGVAELVIAVLAFILYWFYGGLFEALWNGQTPGKRMTGLRVVRTDGRPINAVQAVLRNVLRIADSLPIVFIPDFFFGEAPLVYQTYLLALVSMTLTRRNQRVGDLVCSTMVVAEDRSRFGKVPAPDEPELDKLLEAIPANFVPSRSLAKALSHYVGRRRYFGPARRQEIAKHVGDLLVARLRLPPDTDHDLLLCALYVRAFHKDDAGGDDDALIAPRVPIPAAAPVPVQPVGPTPSSTPSPPKPTSGAPFA